MTEHSNHKKCGEETKDCCNHNKHGISIPKTVVCIPENSYQNRLGRLFAGETDFLTFDHNCYAWGGLINPHNSGVNLFINSFTISNFTDTPFVGQIWFNTRLPSCSHVSNEVTPENTALCPLPEPEAKLRYASCVGEKPRGGVNPFLRIAEPYRTILAEQNGRQIIPPGGNYVIILKPIELCSRRLTAKLVFSWWEEKAICSEL